MRLISIGLYWLTLAARQAHKEAQLRSAVAQTGLAMSLIACGKKNEALYWFKLSADQGVEAAKTYLETEKSGLLNVGLFSSTMSQIFKASPAERERYKKEILTDLQEMSIYDNKIFTPS